MAAEQIVFASGIATSLVGLQQDADVEVLNCGALKELEVLGPRVGTSAKARVDAIDNAAIVQLILQEGDAAVDQIEDIRDIRQARLRAMAAISS